MSLQALEVQKRKGSNEKSEVAQLQRENQSLKETCQDLETKKHRLASDLSTKENQVIHLEQKLAELGHQQNSEKVSFFFFLNTFSCVCYYYLFSCFNNT